ncbi:MAG: hypothetical protein AB7U82_08285 [Blastocatellales bacterium]
MSKQFLSARAQMAIVGVGLWLLLALWSLSAFWQHIDDLGASYRLASHCGAMGGEFALLALVLFHCFNKHIGVRRWSLIFGFILASVILIHAGALRGASEAKTARLDTEKRLTEALTHVSNDQSANLAETNAQIAAGRRQRERLALADKSNAQQGEIAKAAQEKIAAEITATDEKVKDASILPRWYLDGWCYSVLFILSLLFISITFLLMMNNEDIDTNFDGKPDKDQPDLFPKQERSTPSATAPVAASSKPTPKPVVTWRGGRMVSNEGNGVADWPDKDAGKA